MTYIPKPAVLLLTIIALYLAFLYFFFEEHDLSITATEEIPSPFQNQTNQQDLATNASNNSKNDTAVIAAIIAACASIVGVFFTNYFGRRNQEKLASLQEQSEIRKIKEKALIDYEYEALKRLYNEIEPILFQLVDLSQNAYKHIISLVRTARDGNLEPDYGWLSGVNSYTISTVYRLIAPMSACKLLQRGVTRVDLEVDPSVKFIYFLAKGLYTTFSRPFEAADQEPKLLYDPHIEPVSQNEQSRHTAKYSRQGLFGGELDILTDSLILDEGNTIPRIMSYGEFCNKYFEPPSKLKKEEPFNAAVRLFFNFHPRTHPVLWRLLLLQAHIYKAIINVYDNKSSKLPTDSKPLKIASLGERKVFDWRQLTDKASDQEVLEYPFKAIKNLIFMDVDLGKIAQDDLIDEY